MPIGKHRQQFGIHRRILQCVNQRRSDRSMRPIIFRKCRHDFRSQRHSVAESKNRHIPAGLNDLIAREWALSGDIDGRIMLFGALQRIERHIGGTFERKNLLAGHTNRHHTMLGWAGSPGQHVKHLLAARRSQTGHVGNIGEHRHIECA